MCPPKVTQLESLLALLSEMVLTDLLENSSLSAAKDRARTVWNKQTESGCRR